MGKFKIIIALMLQAFGFSSFSAVDEPRIIGGAIDLNKKSFKSSELERLGIDVKERDFNEIDMKSILEKVNKLMHNDTNEWG